MNQRDKLLRKWRKDRGSITKNAYKAKRNMVHSLVRNAKSNNTRSSLQQNSNDATLFWKALKRVYPTKNKNCHVETSFDIDGMKVSNPQSVVHGFCKYFSSAVNNLKSKAYPCINFVWRSHSMLKCKAKMPFCFEYISTVEATVLGAYYLQCCSLVVHILA